MEQLYHCLLRSQMNFLRVVRYRRRGRVIDTKCANVTAIVVDGASRYLKSFYYLGRRRACSNGVRNQLAKPRVVERHCDTTDLIDIGKQGTFLQQHGTQNEKK